MDDHFEFAWKLSGSGWATCQIADSSAAARYIVSYCTDALADLLRGVGGLYGTEPVGRFSFDLEPAEVRWVLRGADARVAVSIYRFPDMSTSFDAPDADGTLTWSSTLPRSTLTHAVAEAATAVLREHGEDGYKAKWGRHPFPIAELQDLRQLHLRDAECGLPHDPSVP
ncbi:hypothetical protein [Kitasatospora sp. NPDC059571]|uniref:hypothetical protein n=1 Tax=Kitasatospora sp. NPDC059571 TaxID=3346871 RepID=UPI003693D348